MCERVSEEESVKKSECDLSCCLVLPAVRKRRERNTGQVCPARKACAEEGERMLPRLFIVDRGRIAWNIFIGRKYEFGTKTVKIFLRQTIIWNSFCCNNISRELESYSRQNCLEETLSKELIPGLYPLVRYSGPFLKWIREELRQMDRRKRKLMTMHKALHRYNDSRTT